jgi:hypothetical protein
MGMQFVIASAVAALLAVLVVIARTWRLPFSGRIDRRQRRRQRFARDQDKPSMIIDRKGRDDRP